MKNRKGIILAGGNGSRLYPITKGVSKQLLPVYDKPMIYYPICTLMQAGIREILIITNSYNLEAFKRLLGNGSQWGIEIQFKIQKSPDGLAQSFIIGSDFIKNKPSCLILGDNLFYGFENNNSLEKAMQKERGGTIFAYQVSDPKRYGVVEFNNQKQVISIEEKPLKPLSKFAVTGLYFYDENVVEIAKEVIPSKRGELEITSINQIYLSKNLLEVELMYQGMAWLDTGTFDSLYEASAFIHTIEKRQGIKVGAPEEVSWKKGWISSENLENLASLQDKSGYGTYLKNLIDKNNNQ
tara:strand:- start:130 stop:1017 length:888 start_codon:yes stop_codon:yes gene_type:complete